jgi:hypothetical protein
MKDGTIRELSDLRKRLTSQIHAIDMILSIEQPERITSTAEIIRSVENVKKVVSEKPKKSTVTPKKMLWSKQEAIDFIINTIKVHNNVPMCMDEIVNFTDFSDDLKPKITSIVATTLTSLYYSEILTRTKKHNARGYNCYHYKFP